MARSRAGSIAQACGWRKFWESRSCRTLLPEPDFPAAASGGRKDYLPSFARNPAVLPPSSRITKSKRFSFGNETPIFWGCHFFTAMSGVQGYGCLQFWPRFHALARRHRRFLVTTQSSARILTASSHPGIEGAERIFGYQAHEIVGHSILKLIPAERVSEEDYILGLVRTRRAHPPFRDLRRCKDGRMIHVSLTISPIRDADDESSVSRKSHATSPNESWRRKPRRCC